MAKLNDNRILMIVGDFTEDYEAMVPFQALQMIGFQVDAVCPGKRRGEMIKTAIHDFEGDQTYSEKPGHLFRINADFALAEPENYAGLYLAGGRACEYLRLDKQVLNIIKAFMAENRPVAAICHGPQLLTAADVVRGRKLTAYPAVEPEVRLAGGNFVSVAADDTVTDVNLVTAPAWPAHPKLMRDFTRLVSPTILNCPTP
ncbi:DJ-1/PfpI family protein [Aliirhizobium smilacinae]|uniref:DJ-1/PfpI family protein n=1 Tax=Aliirhizobium smilacinae TaxID=1395944 RepID=A0A5C4XCG3_9HYPH|nr:DJ-1/PfpI family protein [Rhizobium smilacinae]TNM60989.1 DJ-1/PfpI family protein [Rhizobium smilacinae]